ncbi:MAG TPA: hypothetical protein VEC99_16685 [Clostridia bacterium]|nr:hypothetical protein [Clostridia bacterium]
MRSKRAFVTAVAIAVAVVCLEALSASSQTTYCVRAGASGAGDGSDWDNAFPSLPAVLVRGATYYIASGVYPSYTFDDAEDGATVITVKKAIAVDHGTDQGWLPAYGEGQAVFNSTMRFERGYYVFDGQTRNESDWFDGASYGFKVEHSNQHQNIVVGVQEHHAVSSIVIKYVFVDAMTTLPNFSVRMFAIDTDVHGPATGFQTIGRGFVFHRMYVRGGNNAWFLRTTDGAIVEYCAASGQRNNEQNHAETFNLYYSANNAIIRYNQIRDFCTVGTRGTAVVAIAYSGGLSFYGNVVSDFAAGDGVVGFDGYASSNNKIYNNTFIRGVNGNSGLAFGTGLKNEIRNNLWIDCSTISFLSGAGDHDYNGYTGSNAYGEAHAQVNIPTSILVNYAGGDYRLASRTKTGAVLPAPYDRDYLGSVRGADGSWDRGACEFGRGRSSNPVISVSPSSLDFGVIAAGATNQLSFTVRNVGAGTLAGAVIVPEPFGIVSGECYSLGNNQSQTVIVRYRPAAAGNHRQNVTFTGGGGAVGVVSGGAYGASP